MPKRFLLVFIYSLLAISLNSCDKKENENKTNTLFTLLDNNLTNIHFKNTVKENLYFNFLNYPYIYNGGGVASGDINNDGLEDLYFTSNQNNNKLYLNKGGLKFKDITDKANVVDQKGWTTGVTMIDINNDGWLDIYVCKSGSLESHEERENKLFINQKNNSFKESASEYGLNFYGFSIQSYFFDMDNDGDLDMYLVNHRVDFRNNITIDLARDKQIEDYGSDQLFRNDGNTFTNVTNNSGIENKAWGLSASIGDFNNDGWQDVFVANDFFHPDYLYINNKNGTFTDQALKAFDHLSNSSMGSDFEDLNNDLKPDLIVLDMLAEDHIRGKKNMAAMNTNSFNMMVKAGYHHQYMSNTLQLNNGNGTFSEIAQLSGVSKTDWSWAPLIADFDNDGLKDVFITNGISNDLSNQDFSDQMRQNIMSRKKVSLDEAIAMIPSEKLQNYMYKNNGDLTFKKVSDLWGIKDKINSNGVVYSDLDNDGDLDLIINNQEEEAHIYKNNSTNNFITFSLLGSEKNRKGIGTKIEIDVNGEKQSKTLFVSRGYQSSVTNNLHFGLGDASIIDNVKVFWPNGKTQILTDVKVNKTISLNLKDSEEKSLNTINSIALFETVNPQDLGINFLQKENEFNDFDLQLLLPQKQSSAGSPLTVADINADGLEDVFIGNAQGAKGALFIQQKDGVFLEKNKELFESEKAYEDSDAEFVDVDNDGDLDVYITSGSYEVKEGSPLLQDRLYVNDGKGNFNKGQLPENFVNSKGLAFSDYDSDGDQDVFVGSRVKHAKYPLSDKPLFLENRNGKFVNVIEDKFDDLADLQMINDAVFSDYDNDGDDDLIVVGEWMPIVIYENKDSKFIKKEILDKTNGWWQTIKASDIDNDGDVDFIIGNLGTNNKFHPTKEKPLHIYADYFDDNTSFDMALSKVSKTGNLIPVRGKECSSEQTPFLNAKVKTYEAFATSTMSDIYGDEKLNKASHFVSYMFESILLKNNGNGDFEIQKLPNEAQIGPTLGIEIHDINNDGYLDVFGVGNIYDAEVETIRYDASKGYILLGGKDEKFSYLSDSSYFNNGEAKAVKKIMINNRVHFLILNKNDELKILKLKE